MRVFPPADDQTARLAAFIAYGLLGYLIALGCLLIVAGAGPTPARDRIDHHCRRPADACATWRGWARCLSMIIEPPATTKFRLMSLNMYNGGADSREVAQRAERADIVILVEATPAPSKLEAIRLGRAFPLLVGRSERRLHQHRGLFTLPAEAQQADRQYVFSTMGDDSARPRRSGAFG